MTQSSHQLLSERMENISRKNSTVCSFSELKMMVLLGSKLIPTTELMEKEVVFQGPSPMKGTPVTCSKSQELKMLPSTN